LVEIEICFGLNDVDQKKFQKAKKL